MTVSGTFPQTRTVSTSTAFVTTLVKDLVSNLNLRIPLLDLGLGQVVVTVNGICETCDEFSLKTAVDKLNALPSTVLTYTITYANTGSTTLTDLKIVNPTPAFTSFIASACGRLAAGLSNCAVKRNPEPGAAGEVEWTLLGTMLPGATGTVTMDVLVE